jgi:hypothetical protein
MPATEYSYHVKCWGVEVWVAARTHAQAKKFALASSPELKRWFKKGAALHIERQGVLA